MHWRKPFPPRSVRPSPFAELYSLLVTSLRQEEPKTSEVAKDNTATYEPMSVPHSAD
jgi:hypothetical protein